MTLLLTIAVALHLLCVNVVSAGPLVNVGLDLLEGRGSRLAGNAGRYLAVWSLLLVVPGGLLGVAIGWLLWTPAYEELITKRLFSRVHFGAWELIFSLALMALHYVWWRKRPAAGWGERGVRMFVSLLAATNLLYHFPVLFSVIERISTTEPASSEPLARGAFWTLLSSAGVLSRVVHVILAAIASCGIMLLGYALRLKRKAGADPKPEQLADVQQIAAMGGQIALVPTLLQVPVGLWLTASLEPWSMQAVSGNDWPSALMLFVSVVLAIMLMQVLASISIGDAERSKLIRAMAFFVMIVFLMSGVLEQLRAVQLQKTGPQPPGASSTTIPLP